MRGRGLQLTCPERPDRGANRSCRDWHCSGLPRSDGLGVAYAGVARPGSIRL